MPLYETFCVKTVAGETPWETAKGLQPKAPERFNYAYDVLDVLAERTPDAAALLWVPSDGERQVRTFRELAQDSCRLAHALARDGVKSGDAALLLMGDHPLFWPLMMALHRLGAVAVPVSPQLSRQDVAYCLEKSDAALVVAADAGLQTLVGDDFAGRRYAVETPGAGWQDLTASLREMPVTYPRTVETPGGVAEMLCYFTSGTTQKPLLVSHDFRYPLGQIVTGLWLDLRPGDVHLTLSDTGWSKSSWGKLYTPWLFESTLMVFAGQDADAQPLLEVMAREGVTSLCAAPPVYRALLSADAETELPKLRLAGCMAEPLHPEIRELFTERFGIVPVSGYGQTETGVLLAQFAGAKQAPGSLGRPGGLCQVDVVDAEGTPCQAGVSGELVVHAEMDAPPPGLMRGYRGDADYTRRQWQDGLYHTGDIAWRDEWGNYWYVGRADDVIHSAGYRVGPYEVETVLLSHPAVREIAVYGVPDPLRFQVIKASIVLNEGYAPGEEIKKDLQAHVRTATAPYKCPRIFEFVQELPHTINGKLRRGVLREQNA